MGAKAEIGWTRKNEEGVKLDVYVQHVGKDWHFFQRLKRYDQWQRVKEPPLEDWLELLDAVQRMIPRRRMRPEMEGQIKKVINERFPGTKC